MGDSGVKEIAIFTSSKYRLLMDHLETGENWGWQQTSLLFDPPPNNGMILPTFQRKTWYFSIAYNRDYFNRGKSSYVLVSGGSLFRIQNIWMHLSFILNEKQMSLLFTQQKSLDTVTHQSCFRIK